MKFIKVDKGVGRGSYGKPELYMNIGFGDDQMLVSYNIELVANPISPAYSCDSCGDEESLTYFIYIGEQVIRGDDTDGNICVKCALDKLDMDIEKALKELEK